MIRWQSMRLTAGCFVFGLIFQTGLGHADVRMPAIFGDHMVLQQEIKIPIWGWADAGESVTVTLGDHTAKATPDAMGKWRVDLDPTATATTPLTLTVTGKNTLTFTDVLVGDVWLCSGQSNMAFALNRAHDAGTEIPKADDSQLRFFTVGPLTNIPFDPQADLKGRWMVSNSTSAQAFSAVGYFFGHELRNNLHRPIGLIASSVPGMPAQAFMSLASLQKDPPFSNYLHEYQVAVADYPINLKKFPAAQADYQEKLKVWNDATGVAFAPILKQWQDDAAKAKANGQNPPPSPQPATPMPREPAPPGPRFNTPSILFNSIIAPLIPYGIKGVIWYQGEANASNGAEYQTLFPRLIADWREHWGQGGFPFLYVQLANYGGNGSRGFPEVREAQLKTLSVPNTGMAVIIDIGNPTDIHPKDKHDVGIRLALAARHVAYQQDLVYAGPLYDAMKVDGAGIRVTLKETGSGLKMGAPPWTPNGVAPPTPTELTGFSIAGSDQKWADAKAVIDGTSVMVSSDQVPAPVAVRYGWAPSPTCNLYNNEGLPASPFRTDDWRDPKVQAAPATPPPAPTP